MPDPGGIIGAGPLSPALSPWSRHHQVLITLSFSPESQGQTDLKAYKRWTTPASCFVCVLDGSTGFLPQKMN